ncbi:MAG: hypothetical protein ACQPRJ_03990 [Solitalea-like symbiont of Acarus siro]
MLTGLDISTKVYQVLVTSPVKSEITGIIDYCRDDYSKEDIVIIPRTVIGDKSLRFSQINVNIHVPDITNGSKTKPNLARLAYLSKLVIATLKSHYEYDEGYNWYIATIDPPYKENDINEHFVTLKLDVTIRNN